MLFSGSDDGTIRLWDLTRRDCVRVFEGHVGQVQSLKLCIVDREKDDEEDEETPFAQATGQPASSSGYFEPNPVGVYGTPSYSLPTGPHLMAQHPTVSSTEARTSPPPLGQQDAGYVRGRSPGKMAGETDEKQAILVSASLDNTVRVWDVETGKTKKTLFGHSTFLSFC